MEELFLFAEKITGTLKSVLSKEKDFIGNFYFDKATINNSSFELIFSSSDDSITLTLNTHHLEMPWCVQVFIGQKGTKIDFNKVVNESRHQEIPYEAYPNLLHDPNGLGEDLSKEIANDLLNYLKAKAV